MELPCQCEIDILPYKEIDGDHVDWRTRRISIAEPSHIPDSDEYVKYRCDVFGSLRAIEYNHNCSRKHGDDQRMAFRCVGISDDGIAILVI
jgi:hypothetical protein